MWCICVACHRSAKQRVPRGKADKLACSNCGSHGVRVTRVLKQAMLNGGQIGKEDARIMTFAGLRSIARERGYKDGYAKAMFREIFWYWPNDYDAVEPADPNAVLMEWIRLRNVAYAKKHFPREPKKLKPAAPPSDLMTPDDWDVGL